MCLKKHYLRTQWRRNERWSGFMQIHFKHGEPWATHRHDRTPANTQKHTGWDFTSAAGDVAWRNTKKNEFFQRRTSHFQLEHSLYVTVCSKFWSYSDFLLHRAFTAAPMCRKNQFDDMGQWIGSFSLTKHTKKSKTSIYDWQRMWEWFHGTYD